MQNDDSHCLRTASGKLAVWYILSFSFFDNHESFNREVRSRDLQLT